MEEGSGIKNSKEILKRRKEIEQELIEMLKEAGGDFDLEDIKEIIYNEEDQDDFMQIVAMFDNGQGAGELENILEVASDAWNYFPHKALGGKSPAETSS